MISSQIVARKEGEINRKFKFFISNTRWINKNIENLKKQYPNRYIVVYNKKVILTDRDLSDLKEKIKTSELDPEKIAIEFVKEKPLKLLV